MSLTRTDTEGVPKLVQQLELIHDGTVLATMFDGRTIRLGSRAPAFLIVGSPFRSERADHRELMFWLQTERDAETAWFKRL